ncbi:MAG: UDP-N-acetylmuramoyl-tripeptide--D-alanyl-D-alanine ligase [Deltaproteobacteria bacterium]|nr:UDP-N-acetylmuramoyl-tripeptide--D-alanyl-D-alanine ligase [Deltaproteobacteria bacterium]
MRGACEGLTARMILEATGGRGVAGDLEKTFEGLETDSRQIGPRFIFWALRGERFDGHDFVAEAAERGASGAVVTPGRFGASDFAEDFTLIEVPDTLKALGDLAAWWRSRHKPFVVAVTGSAGKTTTKEMIAEILALSAPTLKTEGNFNNLIGLPLTLLRLRPETERVVLEMGMNRPGEIARLTRIARPHVGLITNVAKAHLEGVGDLEGVARAKTELIREMPADGRVVLNGDDALLLRTARSIRPDAMTFGLGQDNDVRAVGLEVGRKGEVSFTLVCGSGRWPVKLPGYALQDVQNALAAAAVGFCLQIDPGEIILGLGRFRGLPGRFQVTALRDGARLVDDTYNANPASLKAGLESLEAMAGPESEIIIGLGEMMELGEETHSAHREAGRMAASLKPVLFLALGAHGPAMVQGALEGGLEEDRVLLMRSHEELAQRIIESTGRETIVFLKGSRMAGMDRVARQITDRLKSAAAAPTGKEETACSTN